MNGWRLSILFFVFLFGLWEGLFLLAIWPPYLFPSPLSVLSDFIHGFVNGNYFIAIFYSLRRIAIGYGISLLFGIPFGLLLGRIRFLQDTIGALLLGLQALPSICWLPLALLWFGLSEDAITFVVIMGAVLSIVLSTADGVKNTNPLYLRAARTMGSSGFSLYLRVILPAALPSILSGMKLGWSFAWRSLMAGELLYVSLGLGHLLSIGRELNDMGEVVSIMLMIVGLGLTIDFLIFRRVEQVLRERWGLQMGS
jgi:NitT/TauT family transport system permease protein